MGGVKYVKASVSCLIPALTTPMTLGPSLTFLCLSFLVYKMGLISALYFPVLKNFLKGLTEEGF